MLHPKSNSTRIGCEFKIKVPDTIYFTLIILLLNFGTYTFCSYFIFLTLCCHRTDHTYISVVSTVITSTIMYKTISCKITKFPTMITSGRCRYYITFPWMPFSDTSHKKFLYSLNHIRTDISKNGGISYFFGFPSHFLVVRSLLLSFPLSKFQRFNSFLIVRHFHYILESGKLG